MRASSSKPRQLKARHLTLFAALAGLLVFNSAAAIDSARADTWTELKPVVFKDRQINPAKGEIRLEAPYRAADDRRVPVTINAKLNNGEMIRRITFIIDENPMPVSAVINMEKPRDEASFTSFMRLNGPSTLRAVLETSTGALYMTERFVKTSGLGACAAPPVGDPEEMLVDLGKMQLTPKLASDDKGQKATKIKRAAHLKIKHPNLTGLQMDQITLQYILARFVKKIDVSHGDEKLFSLTASISFSENPELTFDYLYNGSEDLTVNIVDTDKAEFKKSFPIGIGS